MTDLLRRTLGNAGYEFDAVREDGGNFENSGNDGRSGVGRADVQSQDVAKALSEQDKQKLQKDFDEIEKRGDVDIFEYLAKNPDVLDAIGSRKLSLGKLDDNILETLKKLNIPFVNSNTEVKVVASQFKHMLKHLDRTPVHRLIGIIRGYNKAQYIGVSKGHRNGLKIRFIYETNDGIVQFIQTVYGKGNDILFEKTVYEPKTSIKETVAFWESRGILVGEVATSSGEGGKNTADTGAKPPFIGPTDNNIADFVRLSNANTENYVIEDAIKQKFGSGNTSLRQVAAGFKKIDFAPGTVNLDLGGGKFDEGTKYLAEKGVTNLVFDPVNRNAEHNKKIYDAVKNGGVDTVTCNNVLNVIAESAARSNVILQCAKALKPNGVAYFTVYEGDGSGNGRQSQADSWQENRKTADYLDEIKEHFADVSLKNKVITAKNPIIDGKVSSWFTDASFENPLRFSVDPAAHLDPTLEDNMIEALLLPVKKANGELSSLLDGGALKYLTDNGFPDVGDVTARYLTIEAKARLDEIKRKQSRAAAFQNYRDMDPLFDFIVEFAGGGENVIVNPGALQTVFHKRHVFLFVLSRIYIFLI